LANLQRGQPAHLTEWLRALRSSSHRLDLDHPPGPKHYRRRAGPHRCPPTASGAALCSAARTRLRLRELEHLSVGERAPHVSRLLTPCPQPQRRLLVLVDRAGIDEI